MLHAELHPVSDCCCTPHRTGAAPPAASHHYLPSPACLPPPFISPLQMVDRLDADAIPQQVCSNSYGALHKMVAKALFRWVEQGAVGTAVRHVCGGEDASGGGY